MRREDDSDPRAQIYSKDFNNMEGFDPSVSGYKIVFDKDIPMEIRIQGANGTHEIGAMERIKCRMLLKEEFPRIKQMKLELTSDTDLFFYFTSL